MVNTKNLDPPFAIDSEFEALLPALDSETFSLLESQYDGKFSVIKDYQEEKLLKELGIDDSDKNEILNYISLKKNHLELPNPQARNTLEKLYFLYEQEKDRQNFIDYEDMLLKAYELMVKDKSVLEYCIERYKFLLVDEAQDMNKAQYETIKLLGSLNNNIFIVNDPLQNIYTFRGSDNQYVLNFHKDWDNTSVINLNINYRSTENLVRFSNNFAKSIEESNHEFYVESKADKPGFKEPVLTVYINEFDEAYGIAEKIKELVILEQYHYKDFAVLARANAQLQIYESVLYDNELPYSIVDGSSFSDKTEIKIILSYLKLANDLNDNDSFRNIYGKPNRYLGGKFLEECECISKNQSAKSLYHAMHEVDTVRFQFGISELHNVIDTLRRNKDIINVKDSIDYLRKRLDIDGFVSKDISENNNNINEKVENLNALEQIASRFDSVSDFLGHMAKLSNRKNGENNHIKLLTIHKSKGLEFPVVFLIGLNDGILPHSRSENIEEEKRLAYVAITRAERELYCSYVNEYNGKFIRVSQFVNDMFRIGHGKIIVTHR